jgi:hypothetical protein
MDHASVDAILLRLLFRATRLKISPCSKPLQTSGIRGFCRWQLKLHLHRMRLTDFADVGASCGKQEETKEVSRTLLLGLRLHAPE